MKAKKIMKTITRLALLIGSMITVVPFLLLVLELIVNKGDSIVENTIAEYDK